MKSRLFILIARREGLLSLLEAWVAKLPAKINGQNRRWKLSGAMQGHLMAIVGVFVLTPVAGAQFRTIADSPFVQNASTIRPDGKRLQEALGEPASLQEVKTFGSAIVVAAPILGSRITDKFAGGDLKSIFLTRDNGIKRLEAIESKEGSKRLKVALHEDEWMLQLYEESAPRREVLRKEDWVASSEAQALKLARSVGDAMIVRFGLRLSPHVSRLNLDATPGLYEWPSYGFLWETWGKLGKALPGTALAITISAETGDVLRYSFSHPSFRIREPLKVLDDGELEVLLKSHIRTSPDLKFLQKVTRFKRMSYGYTGCPGEQTPDLCAIALLASQEPELGMSVAVSAETGQFLGLMGFGAPGVPTRTSGTASQQIEKGPNSSGTDLVPYASKPREQESWLWFFLLASGAIMVAGVAWWKMLRR